MSYQVIARKWRPQAFDEVTGQDHITRTLRNAIEHRRLHHAYVFSGARGVGKTTTARLFAKALNCHKWADPNPEPCRFGVADICASCLEIAESRSMDVIEFDAASNTGVQDIRDIILENINVSAARDRYKIFIIDEVHMLSTSSFNALLKTVEEPPQNVIFIMATTELHKVPDTITSRSQEFIFRTIPQSQIFARLRLIADSEGIDIADPALQMIARSGEGSMRDAQSNFDQVISFSGASIGPDDVTKALGLASGDAIETIIRSLSTHESNIALAVVADLVDRGQDLRAFCREILAVLRDVLIYKVSGGDEALVESSVLSADALREHSERFLESDLIRLFHSLAETETKLRDAVQSRYVLEIGLVKLIEIKRLSPIDSLLDHLGKLEAALTASPVDLTSGPSAAVEEKKTVKSEIPPSADDFDRLAEPAAAPVSVSAGSPRQLEEPHLGIGYRDREEWTSVDSARPEPDPRNITASYDDLSFVASLPVKLPSISSDDLEHFEHRALDDQFERTLTLIGESDGPILKASEIVQKALGGFFGSGVTIVSNGTAAAPARTPLNIQLPDLKPPEEGPRLPWPGAGASEEELLAYANSDPSVNLVKHVFRARIKSVSKRLEPS